MALGVSGLNYPPSRTRAGPATFRHVPASSDETLFNRTIDHNVILGDDHRLKFLDARSAHMSPRLGCYRT